MYDTYYLKYGPKITIFVIKYIILWDYSTIESCYE